MADRLDRDVLFAGLTRPQMLLGVTYPIVIGNAVLTTELFLLTRSAWVIAVALIVHVVGWLALMRDTRLIDIWLIKGRRCPRVRNAGTWRCNSYRP